MKDAGRKHCVHDNAQHRTSEDEQRNEHRRYGSSPWITIPVHLRPLLSRPVMYAGLVSILSVKPDIEVVGTAGDLAGARRLLADAQLDILARRRQVLGPSTNGSYR